MKHKFLLPLVLILINTSVFAQSDSIRKEILKQKETPSMLISKGRSLLLDQFLASDYKKVKDIKDYLINDVENDDFAAFYPVELWMIMYWTKEYADLAVQVSMFDSTAGYEFNRKIKPTGDVLFRKVGEQTRDSRNALKSQIQETSLELMEKDFLQLNLDYLVADPGYPDITQDYLNDISDIFLKNYPNSRYENFIRQNIRFKYIPSDWGFGFEFFSGYGILTDELSEKFSNNVPIGVAFDIAYKKYTLYLRDYIGFAFTNKDIDYSKGIWKKDSQVRAIMAEASLGYDVFENNDFKITPFAGIAGLDISPTENDTDEDKNLKDAGLSMTTTYTIGINYDIKFPYGTNTSYSVSSDEYWFIRLRYAYNLPQFNNKYTASNGNMHYLTIGFGGMGRKSTRDL